MKEGTFDLTINHKDGESVTYTFLKKNQFIIVGQIESLSFGSSESQTIIDEDSKLVLSKKYIQNSIIEVNV